MKHCIDTCIAFLTSLGRAIFCITFNYFLCLYRAACDLKIFKLSSVRYLTVGGFAFVLDFIIFWILAPFGIVLAQVVSRTLGAVFGFFGHKLFTFKSFKYDINIVCHESARYFLLFVLSFSLSVISIYVLASGLGVQPLLSKIMTEVFVLTFNYLIMKVAIFNKIRN